MNIYTNIYYKMLYDYIDYECLLYGYCYNSYNTPCSIYIYI